MTKRGIQYKDKSITTIRVKLILFLFLFIINLFLSNTLTYYNRDEMNKVLYFSFLAVIVSMLLAHVIFKLIYNSLKQIEHALDDLQKGGTGQIYPISLDREFVRVAIGVNSASRTIREYQEHLEEKVKTRTQELNQALSELKHQEEKLQTELDFAADIQKGIIPHKFPPWNGIRFAAFYSPMGKVSGDYYDIFYFPDHIFVLLADVSGHGVPAALITMAAKQTFNSIVSDKKSPSDIFREANEKLCEQIKTSDYLTAFLLKIDLKNRIQYSNAAHPKAIHYVQSKDDYFLLDTDGMFIGSFLEAKDSYETKETQLSSGDRFYLYTDGIVEHKNLEGEEFGMDRLLEILNTTKNLPIEEQVKLLTEELYKFIGKAKIKDDISILAFELETIWGKFTEMYNSALKFLKSGKLQTALEKLNEAYAMVPTYTNIHFQLSLVYYHLGDFTRAEKHISDFLQSKPTDLQGIKLGINIYSKLGKEKEKKYLMNIYNELENT